MRKLRIRLSTLACVALVTAGFPGLVRADEVADNGALTQRLFAAKTFEKKTYACFVRRYDAAHLKAHPRQKVGAMKLLLTAEKLPEDGELHYGFSAGVSLRKQPGNWTTGGDCGHAEVSATKDGELAINCSVDCDGGGVAVGLAGDDKAVTVRLERLHLWGPKDDQERDLEAGADDRAFRLDRVDTVECAALVTDHEEQAALRHE
jgi:hypothetical protein